LIKVKSGFLLFAGIAMLVWLVRAAARQPEDAMDNEYIPPHGANDPPGGEAAAPLAGEAAAPLDAAAVVEQVRELLFGDHRRATESALKTLEDRLAALTATIEARFADLERRLAESRSETEHVRDAHVESIGAAISELGERIKSLIAKPPA
jgi:hypothetical protein